MPSWVLFGEERDARGQGPASRHRSLGRRIIPPHGARANAILRSERDG